MREQAFQEGCRIAAERKQEADSAERSGAYSQFKKVKMTSPADRIMTLTFRLRIDKTDDYRYLHAFMAPFCLRAENDTGQMQAPHHAKERHASTKKHDEKRRWRQAAGRYDIRRRFLYISHMRCH